MNLLKRVLFIAVFLLSKNAWSLTLEQAKQQGRVGETFSGYLAAVVQDHETVDFVNSINLSRVEKYRQIADRNNIKTADVARMAGYKLIERASSGEYVRGINGMWLKK